MGRGKRIYRSVGCCWDRFSFGASDQKHSKQQSNTTCHFKQHNQPQLLLLLPHFKQTPTTNKTSKCQHSPPHSSSSTQKSTPSSKRCRWTSLNMPPQTTAARPPSIASTPPPHPRSTSVPSTSSARRSQRPLRTTTSL